MMQKTLIIIRKKDFYFRAIHSIKKCQDEQKYREKSLKKKNDLKNSLIVFF